MNTQHSRRLVLSMALALTFLAGVCHAAVAIPQVGTYVGKMSSKTYSYGTGARSTFNIAVTLVINGDGSWTLNGTNFNVIGQSGVYGAVDAALKASDNNGGIATIPLRFSKGKAQGTIHVVQGDSTTFFIDGKLSLTRQ